MFGATVNTILGIIAIAILIFVHELGHFLAAKAVGVRVEKFSLGFGPKILGFCKGSTEYLLSAIPLGGYVKLAGEMAGEGSGKPDEFMSKGPGARALVFVSGVTMNVLFALVAFMVAFAIGVPFEVGKVGEIEKGLPAWEAGLEPGDNIVRLEDIKDPDFQDIQRHVALMGRDYLDIEVERNGHTFTRELRPMYDAHAGMNLVGFSPPVKPIVTAVVEIDGKSPAQDAGLRINDRVVSVNGMPVKYFRDIQQALERHVSGKVEVEIQRNSELLSVEIEPFRQSRYVMGISSANTEIAALRREGVAERAGLKRGDTIKKVNDKPLLSLHDLEEALKDKNGMVELGIERNNEIISTELEVAEDADDFLYSIQTGTSRELTWVDENGPAWEAGIRPGDVIIEIGNRSISVWEDVIRVHNRLGGDPRKVTWLSEGEEKSAELQPKASTEGNPPLIGAYFRLPERQVRRENVIGSITTGFRKTYGAFADMVYTIRGFATRDVSTQHVGGIVIIAYAAYHAAATGAGQLLYFSAMISIALAFLNILPIPVLDGGHLMFVGIEKLRGKPVSERMQGLSQTIGLVLLLLLVAYAIRNDILRIFNI